MSRKHSRGFAGHPLLEGRERTILGNRAWEGIRTRTLLTSLGLWAAWMGLPSVPIEPVSTEHARAAVCACARRDSSTGRGSQGTGTETPSQRRGRDGTGGTRRLRRGRCASAPRDPCLEWTTHRRTSPWPARLAIGQGPPRQARRCSMRTGDGSSRGSATPPGLSRRRWLQGVTATAGLLTLSQCGRVRTVPPRRTASRSQELRASSILSG
jgi:hypothetical protein